MQKPILSGLEFRSVVIDEIRYIDRKTGKAESFTKNVIRAEADDSTPVMLTVRTVDDEPFKCTLKKGKLFSVGITHYATEKGNVEASCLSTDLQGTD